MCTHEKRYRFSLEQASISVCPISQCEYWIGIGSAMDPVGTQLHKGGPERVGQHTAAPSGHE